MAKFEFHIQSGACFTVSNKVDLTNAVSQCMKDLKTQYANDQIGAASYTAAMAPLTELLRVIYKIPVC
jgi:hypothetical protein